MPVAHTGFDPTKYKQPIVRAFLLTRYAVYPCSKQAFCHIPTKVKLPLLISIYFVLIIKGTGVHLCTPPQKAKRGHRAIMRSCTMLRMDTGSSRWGELSSK